ncbi:MAG: PhoH family protein [Bacillota bacterium]|nr:PhoH family protein [Bacillota bacterium]
MQKTYVLDTNILLSENPSQSALAYFNGQKLLPLRYLHHRPFGISPKNADQNFLQEALYCSPDEASLVIARGPAGTAKTFYSLAVGLDMVMSSSKKAYRKILFCRPNITMDEDIGFLPGTESEKLGPLLRGVKDNLEILLDTEEECERSYLASEGAKRM